MINIYRSNYSGCSINHFYGKKYVEHTEVIVKTKNVFGREYRYVEPIKKGNWAFGGDILYTSNGIFPEFNIPIKLHDRNMDLERR